MVLNLGTNGGGRKRETRHFGGHTDFRKQLRWLMNDGGTVPVTITPEIATIILELNTGNRPVSEKHVKALAAEMKAGRWVYTRAPIIISDEGRVIDGQHRLLACILAGVSIMVDIAFNAPDRAFAFIDQGKKRTAADIFSIRDVPNSALVAAAMRWILDYENHNIHAGHTRANKVTPDALYQFYTTHADIQGSTWVCHKLQSNKTRIIEGAIAVAFHYLCGRKDKPLADRFYTKLAEGFGWTSHSEPSYQLYNRLIQNLSAATTAKLPAVHKAAFLVKAWNAERLGKRIKVFRWIDGEEFPEVL